MEKTITVVGGPFPQQVDPVLQLVPTGKGNLAARIADECEAHFKDVQRIGNFPGGTPCTFEQLQEQIVLLDTDVLIFLPHLPNVLLESSPTKIRLQEGQS